MVQLLKRYNLVFRIFFSGGGGGLISFVPQGLSGIGWMHTKSLLNMLRTTIVFSFIPVMPNKKEHRKEKEFKHLRSVCKYAEDVANIFECSQRAPPSVRV